MTIMFCDLVGSTALSTEVDPEEMHDVLAGFHRCCTKVINRFGGYVGQYLGDGLLVYFGYPRATEEDAERAVFAALALVEAVAAVSDDAGRQMQIRISIATGLVVIGQLGGSDAANHGIAGETPNLAARLNGLAGAGEIIVSSPTRDLLGELFDFRDLGRMTLKGFGQPVQVWAVLGKTETASRFEAKRAPALAPMAGRNRENAMLMRHWRQATGGNGNSIAIIGEPGIGKSRLIAALENRLSSESHSLLRFDCSPLYTNSALHPVIGEIERTAGFERRDTDTVKLEKLRTLLARSPIDIAQTTDFLSDLLGLTQIITELSPQRRMELTLRALLTWLQSASYRGPLLMIFEDVHWIDPSSLELLRRLAPGIRNRRALLVMTARPEFAPFWRKGEVSRLSLDRLSRADTESVVRSITRDTPLPDKVLEHICVRTEGVPLFIEEFTRTVLDTRVPNRSDRQDDFAGAGAPVRIPATLQDSLQARLDLLSGGKEIIQVGAAIGRDFSRAMLAAVLGDRTDLDETLDQLVGCGLLFRRAAGTDIEYSFKHALLRDVAYERMVTSRRRHWHRRIAVVLEAPGELGVAEVKQDLIAWHFREAGDPGAAFRFWIAAGDRAERSGSIVEAIAHYRSALALFNPSSMPEQIRSEKPALLMKLGSALQQSEGYHSEEALRVYEEARSLAEQLNRPADVARAAIGMAPLLYGDCRYRDAAAQMGDASPSRLSDIDPTTAVHLLTMLSVVHVGLGEYAQALDYAARACALDANVKCTHQHPVGGGDPAVVARGYGALALFVLGRFSQSLAMSRESLAIARDRSHAFSIAWALRNVGRTLIDCGSCDEAFSHLSEAVEICERNGFETRLGNVLFLRGFALIDKGSIDRGVTEIGSGMDLWRRKSGRFHMTFHLAEAADRFIRLRRLDDADKALREAGQIASETDEASHSAELLRLRGLLLQRQSLKTDSLNYLQRAIHWSSSHRQPLFELRAARDLLLVSRSESVRLEARHSLTGLLDKLPGNPDITDIRLARGALAT